MFYLPPPTGSQMVERPHYIECPGQRLPFAIHSKLVWERSEARPWTEMSDFKPLDWPTLQPDLKWSSRIPNSSLNFRHPPPWKTTPTGHHHRESAQLQKEELLGDLREKVAAATPRLLTVPVLGLGRCEEWWAKWGSSGMPTIGISLPQRGFFWGHTHFLGTNLLPPTKWLNSLDCLRLFFPVDCSITKWSQHVSTTSTAKKTMKSTPHITSWLRHEHRGCKFGAKV